MTLIRHDFDVDRATPDALRAYIYDLEQALTDLLPDETGAGAAMLRRRFPGIGIKPAALLAFLSDGRPHSKQAIHTALYGAGEGPSLKIVDVFVCKVRVAIHGAPFHIETLHRDGYRLVDPQGVLTAFLNAATPFAIDASAAAKGRRTIPATDRLLVQIAARQRQAGAVDGVAMLAREFKHIGATDVGTLAGKCAARGLLTIVKRAERRAGKGWHWHFRLTAKGIAHVEALLKAGGE